MWLQVYLAAVFVGFALGEGDGTARRTAQVPFVADAVGNSLPPPAELPAKVGSPSNLLSPDRYEFYTFDESGELVKRLMTLEEIQAIVAAGEGNDGHMVTFAQDEKPTIAFNFSQPPFTKVHNVVTNVQNVLKSQMEAQKKNPPNPTTFDTPDVSNSWSMILPSIFGNTGVDIVPDKLPSTFGTPETDTIDLGSKLNSSDLDSDIDALSKEETGENVFESSLNTHNESKLQNEDFIILSTIMTSTTTTTSPKPQTTIKTTVQEITAIPITTPTTAIKSTKSTTTTTTRKPTTTTTTTRKPTTTTTTTWKPTTTKTNEPSTTTSTTTNTPTSSTPKSLATIDPKPTIKTNEVINRTNLSGEIKYDMISNSHKQENLSNKHQEPITIKSTTEIKYIKIKDPQISSNVITTPKAVTTSQVSTEKATILQEQIRTETATKNVQSQLTVTTYRPSSTSESNRISITNNDFSDNKNHNGTTLTTQSVSPSTTHSTTEVISAINMSSTESSIVNKIENATENIDPPKNVEQDFNQEFDVAQSISQIASDLGDNVPVQNNEAQIKENGDVDLRENLSNKTAPEEISSINFVKVTTTDPQNYKENQIAIPNKSISTTSTEKIDTKVVNVNSLTHNIELATQINPAIYLSDSMNDLLSQVVNQPPNSIMHTTDISTMPILSTDSPLNRNDDMDIITTTADSIKEFQVNKDYTSNNINFSNNAINAETSHKSNGQIGEKNSTNKHDFIKLPLGSTSASAIFPEEIQKDENISTVTTIMQQENRGEVSKAPFEKPEISKTESAQVAISLFQDTENKKVEKINTTINSLKISDAGKPTVASNSSNKTDSQNTNENNTNVSANNQKNESKVIKTNTSPTNSQQKLSQKVSESKKKIQKVNIDEKEYGQNTKNDSWKLVSTVSPHKINEIPISKPQTINSPSFHEIANDPSKEINLDVSNENQGLEITTKNLGEDVYQFTELCNELAFRYWSAATENIDKRRSFVLSPYSITSMLAMMFMGARGATSGEMNDILKLDDMVTFNPHFTLKNISDSIETNPGSGVAVSAFVRELYSDRNRGKLLTFYKERAQHFYSGHVEEINFKLINDIIRRRTNLLVKRYTWGKINEFIKSNDISMTPPLAAFSANIFETDCTGSSVEGRDGEMYFVVSPSVRQRRLVPVPAVVYRGGFLAGYHPGLDATAAAVGPAGAVVSLVLLMPGQQGGAGRVDDLERLERDLLAAVPAAPHWHRLLRTLLPRPALELQIPRFAHRSVFNVSAALRRMGLRELFDPARADLGGLNGPSKDLHLSDMVEASAFATCGEAAVGEQHHSEEYPARRRRSWEEPRDYQRAFHDPHDVGAALPLHLRPRQARLPAPPAPAPHPARLKFDRPFLYFVRHNPSGMILYVGRYNPRLLP